MNELQIKTMESIPAKIEFNKYQLIDELNVTLKKYENLVFTEDNTPEIRKALAELRKGKRAANDYRLSIKRELIAPVTEFENDIKDITKLFDDVINPINDQLKEYEENRRNEKRKELETIIEETIQSVGLNEKYANQLTIDEQYLNKSTSIRTAKESIEFNANNLLNEQKVEEMNKESIEMFVKLKNSENDLNLSVTAYLSQLEYKDVEEVKNTIDEDVIKELEHNEKRLKEIELKAEKEKERIKQESIEAEPLKSIVNDLPFENIEQDEETATETESNETIEFRVYVPVNKLNSLIDFLRKNDIDYYDERELPF